jgi:hypothetical protein
LLGRLAVALELGTDRAPPAHRRKSATHRCKGLGSPPATSEQVARLRGDWAGAAGDGHQALAWACRSVRRCNVVSGVATCCLVSSAGARGPARRRADPAQHEVYAAPLKLGFMFGPAHGSAGRCVLRSRRSDQATQRRAFLLAALPPSPGQRRTAVTLATVGRTLLCSLNVRGKPILNSAAAAVQVTPGGFRLRWRPCPAQARLCAGAAAAGHAGASRAGALRRRIPNRQLLLWED